MTDVASSPVNVKRIRGCDDRLMDSFCSRDGLKRIEYYYLRVLSPLVFLTLRKWRAIFEINSFTSIGIVTRVDDIVEKKTSSNR